MLTVLSVPEIKEWVVATKQYITAKHASLVGKAGVVCVVL